MPLPAGPPNALFDRFGILVTYAGTHTVLAVHGDIDLATAPELGGFLQAVIDRGHLHVVLDMTDLGFIDASGLNVMATAMQRLDGMNGSLELRSPTKMLRKMLRITGLEALLSFSEEHSGEHLGPAESQRELSSTQSSDAFEVRRSLARVAALAADLDVVDSALRLVVALARASLHGADGVSISLRRHGNLSTVAATDQTILDMDAGQYTTGEGPCVAASSEGRWFHAASLEDETRWPTFIPRARQLGINAILSTPLLDGDVAIGALNIYSRTAEVFAAREQQLAAVFAHEASGIVAAATLGTTEEELSARFRLALRLREVISQAQGVLMEREHLSELEAYTRLRHLSQTTSISLHLHSAEVVASTQSLTPGGISSPASLGGPGG